MKKQTLGEMIASLRKEQGMTQAVLADKMNVTDKAVSKWERDLSCPDINSMPKLAEILNVTVDELMQGKACPKNESIMNRINEVIQIVLKAIVVAMGTAVLVLSILDKLDLHTGFTLLSIGMLCIGIVLLQDRQHLS